MDKVIQTFKQQFTHLLQSDQLSHAHLLECPLYKPIRIAIDNAISIALCAHATNCGDCKSCILLSNNTHPDLIQLSNTQQSIKVSEIRNLAQQIYQSPKISRYRMIVIHLVEKLNRSSANALLKMLEEPPKNVLFVLSCHNISRVIPTIRSRTIRWQLPVSFSKEEDWEYLFNWIDNDEGKRQVLDDKSLIIDNINAIFDNTIKVYDIIQQWQQYPIDDLLWVLYLLHARALRQNYSEKPQNGYFGNNSLLLKQIEKIHAMIKLSSQGVTLNNILMFETLLMSYRGIAK